MMINIVSFLDDRGHTQHASKPFVIWFFPPKILVLNQHGLTEMIVLLPKLLRSFVGSPAGMDWTRPWHETLHDWNGRVNEFATLHAVLVKAMCLKKNDVFSSLGV